VRLMPENQLREDYVSGSPRAAAPTVSFIAVPFFPAQDSAMLLTLAKCRRAHSPPAPRLPPASEGSAD